MTSLVGAWEIVFGGGKRLDPLRGTPAEVVGAERRSAGGVTECACGEGGVSVGGCKAFFGKALERTMKSGDGTGFIRWR